LSESAVVLTAVAHDEHSIAARALRAIKIAPQQLAQAATQQIANYER
jgi:hypothetical protein